MDLSMPGAVKTMPYRLPATFNWLDRDTGCTIVLSQPECEPKLWEQYLSGALASYSKYGVESALDFEQMRDGRDTTLFYTAVDDGGRVLGGVRVRGPLPSAEEAHALVEWVDQPSQGAVRKMITERLPFGLVEMRAAWVTDHRNYSQLITKALARVAFPTLSLLDVNFILATAAAHVLERWRTSGGVVAAEIPAAPYPSDRYRTKVMWWDRRTFTRLCEPTQLTKMLQEMRELATQMAELHLRFDASRITCPEAFAELAAH
ncbi:hypothetical protein MSIMFB_01387 [Mycobacterium simulans]|uniref:N-acetyltransferase domain-containing protein n=1 Tax=Mycobacterium simulans TaxID=627089 RepID=A0A7Z7II26_9MYCO|nr:hypothetical protein [Mycobacterium simulans]SOJ53889.1 hypothetical protein MSIMFB_01387 [Mycobacterium simulans]